MRLYELINPSDPYTFRAPDDGIAGLVAIALGEGRYGARRLEDTLPERLSVPTMLDQESLDRWLQSVGIPDLNEYFENNKTLLIEALDSLVIGSARDRACFELALEMVPEGARPEFRERWHEQKLTSLNDIGGFARKLIEHYSKEAGVQI